MKNLIESIKIEKPNANDDHVILTKINFKSGDKVKKHQILGEIETSKAALEIESTANGYVDWLYVVGETVPVNEVICNILNKMDLKITKRKNVISDEQLDKKISKSAAILIKENNIDISLLTEKGLITEKTIKDFLKNNNHNVQYNENKTFQNEMVSNISSANISAILAYVYGEINISNFKEEHIIDYIISSIFKIEKKFIDFRSIYKENELRASESFKLGLIHEENNNLSVLEISSLGENSSIEDYRKAKMKAIYNHYSAVKKGMAKPSIVLSHLNGKYTSYHQPILFPNSSSTIASLLKRDLHGKKLNICIAYDHRVLNGKYVNEFLDFLLSDILENINKDKKNK